MGLQKRPMDFQKAALLAEFAVSLFQILSDHGHFASSQKRSKRQTSNTYDTRRVVLGYNFAYLRRP